MRDFGASVAIKAINPNIIRTHLAGGERLSINMRGGIDVLFELRVTLQRDLLNALQEREADVFAATVLHRAIQDAEASIEAALIDTLEIVWEGRVSNRDPKIDRAAHLSILH